MHLFKFLPIVIAGILISNCCLLVAQQDDNGDPTIDAGAGATVRLPRFARPTIRATVSVPDGGVVVFGGGIRRGSGLRANPYYPKKDESGTRVYDFVRDGKPWKIRINDDGSIDVTMMKAFDENNLDELRRLHPQIAKHYDSFPKKTSAAEKVNLNLEIESTISAMNEAQLKHLYPDIYKVYSERVNRSPFVSTVVPRIIIQEEEEQFRVGGQIDNPR